MAAAGDLTTLDSPAAAAAAATGGKLCKHPKGSTRARAALWQPDEH